MVKDLYKAIFYQRPLKSQKGLVGKCTFENNKARCPISHPFYEKFRMCSFINNIKISTEKDERRRSLTLEEKQKIVSKFYRKRKPYFDFVEIKKELGKENYFNYKDNFTVSGCPTSAQLKNVFGDGWEKVNFKYNIKDVNGHIKEKNVDVHDLWHVIFTFDSVEKLKEFATEKLKLDEKSTNGFSKIILKKDYAALSIKAIKKIIPYLEHGLIYPHAVFMANIDQVVDEEIWQNKNAREELQKKINTIIETNVLDNRITQVINGALKSAKDAGEMFSEANEDHYRKGLQNSLENEFGRFKWQRLEDRDAYFEQAVVDFKFQFSQRMGQGNFIKPKRLDEKIEDLLLGENDTGEVFCSDGRKLKNLYHPSDMERFKSVIIKNEEGKSVIGLGSPATPSVRNPMAMRSLFQLRKLINALIIENKIDQNTKINIELARELNDSNKRIAIRRWQNSIEEKRKEYAEKIKADFLAETGKLVEPIADDILKYQLWEEQKRKCVYTGIQIGISEFIGQNPKYEIEHTLPRSQSEDNSQMNKTLCEIRFNREDKKNRMPFQLKNHTEILQRIDHWEKKYQDLDKQISQITRSIKAALIKEQKDKKIQYRHYQTFERDYFKGKYERFIMEEIPGGFKNSQKVDIGIISKYAREFLSSVSKRVYSVKGGMTAEFRKAWGLQESYKDEFDIPHYKPKDRSNHIHHCQDAIVIACMDKNKYDALAHSWTSEENRDKNKAKRILSATKPWNTFTQDVKKIKEEVFVVHHTPKKVKIQSKKIIRKRGVIQRNEKDEIKYQQGDTVRGSLHKETFYGAIAQNIEGKIVCDEKGDIVPNYVVRKELSNLNNTDVKNIVDPEIRRIIENAVETKQIKFKQNGTTLDGVIWQNEKNKIPLKKVRVYTPSVKNPIKNFKKQRDVSKHEYKRQVNVNNDENYCMAIYEGTNAKGKFNRTFTTVTMLEAGTYYRLSNVDERYNKSLVDDEKKIMSLKYILTKGTMVLFYKENREEIWKLDKEEIISRLYKIIKLNKDGRITFKFNSEARNDEQLKKDYEQETGLPAPKSLTNGESKINFINPSPKLLLSQKSLDFIVENYDFKISITGKLIRMM